MQGVYLYLVVTAETITVRYRKQKLVLVQEPAILLIKWLRPKGLKVCSYVEKQLNSKIKLLKKSAGNKSAMRDGIPGGRQFLKLALKWGTLYHRI